MEAREEQPPARDAPAARDGDKGKGERGKGIEGQGPCAQPEECDHISDTCGARLRVLARLHAGEGKLTDQEG